MKDKADERNPRKKVIRLDDLAPRQDIVGGRGKLIFGEGVLERPIERDRASRPERGRAQAPKGRD